MGLVGLLTALLAACASRPTAPSPPDIRYGDDICDQCGMIISDPAFAAAVQLTSGEHRKFDDIGDLFAYLVSHPEEEVWAVFVHDYDSLEWIRGEDAYYVRGVDLITPMGTGYAAFASEEGARAFADEYGPTLIQRYNDVHAHYLLHGDMDMHTHP